MGSHKTWSRVFRPILLPKYIEYDSIPDDEAAQLIEPKNQDQGMVWKKLMKYFLAFRLFNKAASLWSNAFGFAGNYSQRVEGLYLLSFIFLLCGFTIANYSYGSRWHSNLRSGTLFIFSNLLTVALSLFDLFVQNKPSLQVAIKVTISVLELCYGVIYFQKEWRSVGRKGIIPCSNAVPVLRRGILSVL